jgi:hypothetical protein
MRQRLSLPAQLDQVAVAKLLGFDHSSLSAGAHVCWGFQWHEQGFTDTARDPALRLIAVKINCSNKIKWQVYRALKLLLALVQLLCKECRARLFVNRRVHADGCNSV